ncbi:MAG: hypothetical protein AB7O55_17835 [Lautropia sp.]
MKILLFILSFVSLALFPPGGPNAESTRLAAAGAGTNAMGSVHLDAPAVPLQLASAGIDRSLGIGRAIELVGPSAGLEPAARADDPMPSTSTGLAALLLMICILIGRRNKQESM